MKDQRCGIAAGLALAALWLLAGAASADGQGLLWKLERPGHPDSYLFGTLHTDDPRVLALPAPVQGAFADAAALVVEVDLLDPSAARVAGRMIGPEGSDLRQHLSEQEFAVLANALMARGYPEPVVIRLRPWAALATLSAPPPRSGRFLDLQLMQDARAAGKALRALETLGEQIDTFEALTDAEQLALLRDTLREIDRLPDYIERMHVAYLARDLAALERLADEEGGGVDRQLKDRFQRLFIDERNARMVERLRPLLAERSSFVAVGALHLPGSAGLVQALERAGWTTTRLY